MNAAAEVAVNLSPARAALRDYLDRLASARHKAQEARAPADRLRQQHAKAQQELADAEAELAALDAKDVAAIKDGGAVAPGASPARAKADAAIDTARRTCAAVAQALEEAERVSLVASTELRTLTALQDGFLIDVLAEEHALVLAKREELGRAFVTCDAYARALPALVSEIGRASGPGAVKTDWLRAGERMAGAFAEAASFEAGPRHVAAAIDNVRDWLNRLPTNAGQMILGNKKIVP